MHEYNLPLGKQFSCKIPGLGIYFLPNLDIVLIFACLNCSILYALPLTFRKSIVVELNLLYQILTYFYRENLKETYKRKPKKILLLKIQLTLCTKEGDIIIKFQHCLT